jgi:ABC-type lipoprotein release transport system permease subunit
MTQMIKLAFRDLMRNRRRSILSALALGMGLALLLLMAAVISGEMNQSMQSAINLQSGHLQIRAKTYNESVSSLAWVDLVADPDTLAAQISSLPAVKVATPRLFASGILTMGNDTSGVVIYGIEPASTANVPFQQGLVSGQFLTADDREGILVGQTLADKHNIKTGDKVQLLVNTSSGAVETQEFFVRGIYSTKTPGFDETTVFMPLAKAQTITQAGNHASVIFILLKDEALTDAVATAIQAPQYQVKTWVQLNDLMVQFEQLSNSYMYMLYLIILAITATVIINTLIMTVFERTREIGILAAIGMKSSSILLMFFIESAFLAIGGIAIGLSLGGVFVALATKYGFFIGNMGITGILLGERIYAHLVMSDLITLTIMTFIVSLMAAIYPAILAARMEPVEALRGGKLA